MDFQSLGIEKKDSLFFGGYWQAIQEKGTSFASSFNYTW
jgi:hypothetical protein